MKTYEEINTIMNNISRKTRKAIGEMWGSMILDMGEIRKDSRKHFLSNIKKIGLTEEEYEMWRIR